MHVTAYFDGVAGSVGQKHIVVIGHNTVSVCDVVRYVTTYYLDAGTVTVRTYNEQTDMRINASVTCGHAPIPATLPSLQLLTKM